MGERWIGWSKSGHDGPRNLVMRGESGDIRIDETQNFRRLLCRYLPSVASALIVFGLILDPTSGGLKRVGSWALLVIPRKRREEIVGDFLESIEKARKQGFGRFGQWMLIAAKFLLYAWVVLKLRIGDLAQPSERIGAAKD